MAVKRSEAEVAGHDPRLRDAVDELTDGQASADPLFPDGASAGVKTGDGNGFDPRRYQQQTVPPNVIKAMAAVDLRAVDSGGLAEGDDSNDDARVDGGDSSVYAPAARPPSRSRVSFVVVGALLVTVLVALAVWASGSSRPKQQPEPPTVTVRVPAPTPVPVEPPRPSASVPPDPVLAPTPTPITSQSATKPPRTNAPAAPKRPTLPSASSGYDPTRPVL